LQHKWDIFTSAEEGGCMPGFVCLLVCLYGTYVGWIIQKAMGRFWCDFVELWRL